MKKTLTILAVSALFVGCSDKYDSGVSGPSRSPTINEPSGASTSPKRMTNDHTSGTSSSRTNQNQSGATAPSP